MWWYNHVFMPMNQIPHAEVQELRGFGLHAMDCTAIDDEIVLPQFSNQTIRFVAAAMADEIIERRPMRRMQRHRHQQVAAGPHYA